MPKVPYLYVVNGHGKWFINTNLFLIKPFLIAKFDCIWQMFTKILFKSKKCESSERFCKVFDSNALCSPFFAFSFSTTGFVRIEPEETRKGPAAEKRRSWLITSWSTQKRFCCTYFLYRSDYRNNAHRYVWK